MVHEVPFNGIVPPGYKVVTSNYMIKSVTTQIRRTWRERLLTLPWRPLCKFNSKTEIVPETEKVIIKNNIIFCHPIVAKRIQENENSNEKT